MTGDDDFDDLEFNWQSNHEGSSAKRCRAGLRVAKDVRGHRDEGKPLWRRQLRRQGTRLKKQRREEQEDA